MPWTPAVMSIPLSQVIARYLNGEAARDIARDAGVSYQTVQRRLQAAGIPLRGHAKTETHRRRHAAALRRDIPAETLRELHSRQMSCREMAGILGCDEETVRCRLIELGLPRLAPKARRERNAFWRGGYTVDESGYILQHAPDHPHATAGGYVRQHRLVMEKTLGRYLTPQEVVDHRNGDTSDNRPGNLRLFASNSEHLRATLAGPRQHPAERERLRQEAVLRACRRVAAILAESGNDDGQ